MRSHNGSRNRACFEVMIVTLTLLAESLLKTNLANPEASRYFTSFPVYSQAKGEEFSTE